MKRKMKITIPIRIHSEANLHQHWTKNHARHRKQRGAISLFLGPHKDSIKLPCIITMIRIGPRFIDDDNLVYSMKSCRDYIADLLIPGLAMGRADADPRLKFEYGQEKGNVREYALRIEIGELI